MTENKIEEPSKEFEATPKGLALRWKSELEESKKEQQIWKEEAREIIKTYRDERPMNHSKSDVRWNIFSSNVQTQLAMLYGKVPTVSVERKYADADDDIARVAANILERLLNSDIQKDGDSYVCALRNALWDRLVPGLGCAKVRYEVETEEEPGKEAILGENGEEMAPAIPPTQKKTYECVETDYIPFSDQLWSSGARTAEEIRWRAFLAKMSRAQLKEKFGEEIGNKIPLTSKENDHFPKDTLYGDNDGKDLLARADVWEIWSKDDEKVYWYADGYHEILKESEDIWEFPGFFPCPPPMVANPTTTTTIPRPDYIFVKDLYEEVNELSKRIKRLSYSVKAAGVYDKNNISLARLLEEGLDNKLIPVENYTAFSEKGGLVGAVNLLDISQIVDAMDKLRDVRKETIDAVFQLSGMSDIMRGQATETGVTATEQALKAKFASVRMQALQTEFANFATELQKLKAHLIVKFYDDERIVEQSNIMTTPDAKYAFAAIQLLRQEYSKYKIEVKPEAISMTDFAQLKLDRTEFLAGMSGFFQAAAPIAANIPGSMPFLLKILQWAVAGLRGSSSIESVLDEAITAAQMQQQQQPQQPPPNPKIEEMQLKSALESKKQQEKTQAKLVELNAEIKAREIEEMNQAKYSIIEQREKERLKQQTQSAFPSAGTV